MDNVQVDLISNNQSSGEVANQLHKGGSIDINKKRPYLDENNIPCITVFKGGDPADIENYEAVYARDRGLSVNADTTLRPDEWEQLDAAVTEVAREELTVYDYFVNQNLTKPLKNAFGTTVLQW